MPIRFTVPADQLRAGTTNFNDAVQAPPPSTFGSAAQGAKELAATWQKAGVKNPQRDSAAPWFAPGSRPFSELVAANPASFHQWAGRFSDTDAGFAFRPPPPEPEPMAAASGPADPQPKGQGPKGQGPKGQQSQTQEDVA